MLALKNKNELQSLWPSPATDPTNPYSQETAGQFLANELSNERRLVEPGLTDRDREARASDKEDRDPTV